MKIGFDVRAPEIISDPGSIVRAAVAAEQLGFGYMSLGDHLVTPLSTDSPFPYTPDGRLAPSSALGARYELLSSIAFLAAKTSTMRFLAGIMVFPYRPAVIAAKAFASIDLLSGGRLDIGVGAGWMKEEFAAVGNPDFARRGKVTDEYIQVMKVLWTEQLPEYNGEFVQISGITFEPKPQQKPYPPFWIGGNGPAALRRAAAHGDVWYPVPTDSSRPMDSLEAVGSAMADLRRAFEDNGRDGQSASLALCVLGHGTAIDEEAADGRRKLFSGTHSQIAADIAELHELGVVGVDFRFGGRDVDEAIDSIASFASGVIDPSWMTADAARS